MKLNIKEIKYIRQSLEFKAKYYEDRERYKQYFEEIKPIIKKFKALEGDCAQHCDNMDNGGIPAIVLRYLN